MCRLCRLWWDPARCCRRRRRSLPIPAQPSWLPCRCLRQQLRCSHRCRHAPRGCRGGRLIITRTHYHRSSPFLIGYLLWWRTSGGPAGFERFILIAAVSATVACGYGCGAGEQDAVWGLVGRVERLLRALRRR